MLTSSLSTRNRFSTIVLQKNARIDPVQNHAAAETNPKNLAYTTTSATTRDLETTRYPHLSINVIFRKHSRSIF